MVRKIHSIIPTHINIQRPICPRVYALQAHPLWVEVSIRRAEEIIDVDDSPLAFDHLKGRARVLEAMSKTIYRILVRTYPHRNFGLGLGVAGFAIELVLVS